MPDNRGKPTLEDLLKAKRLERPDSQFWADFDRELKLKQRQLIQEQLASETRSGAFFAGRWLKFGAIATTCGVAAFSVYLGVNIPVGDQSSEEPARLSTTADQPNFEVAVTEPATVQPQAEDAPAIGLQEFATLAQAPEPRVVVQLREEKTAPLARISESSNLAAHETLMQLERSIRAKNPAPRFEHDSFASSTDFFENRDQVLAAEEELDGLWSFEEAIALGKYADPLNRGIATRQSDALDISSTLSVSFSQLDEAISNSGRRNSQRSLDALNVRF